MEEITILYKVVVTHTKEEKRGIFGMIKNLLWHGVSKSNGNTQINNVWGLEEWNEGERKYLNQSQVDLNVNSFHLGYSSQFSFNHASYTIHCILIKWSKCNYSSPWIFFSVCAVI